MKTKAKLGITCLIATLIAGSANATDCAAWPRFSSSEAYLTPLSVEVSKVGEFFSSYEYSQGIQFTSEMRGSELWLDIVEFPGTTTAAGAPRVVMQIGRLVKDDFETLVLSEDGEGLFAISEDNLRNIGCQFIWGREGGQNPIALIRELYKQMEYYETRLPLSTRWNGSLLGDTTLAMTLNNDLVLPKWVVSAIQ